MRPTQTQMVGKVAKIAYSNNFSRNNGKKYTDTFIIYKKCLDSTITLPTAIISKSEKEKKTILQHCEMHCS